MILTCSSQYEDHLHFERLLKGDDWKEVVFGWVLEPGVKCPAEQSKGIYFRAHVDELRDKLGMGFEKHIHNAYLIMFAAFAEGLYGSVMNELSQRLGRDIASIPVMPMREALAAAQT